MFAAHDRLKVCHAERIYNSQNTGQFSTNTHINNSQHSRCMRNPQFYVSGKRPMAINACGARSSDMGKYILSNHIPKQESPTKRVHVFDILYHTFGNQRNCSHMRDKCMNRSAIEQSLCVFLFLYTIQHSNINSPTFIDFVEQHIFSDMCDSDISDILSTCITIDIKPVFDVFIYCYMWVGLRCGLGWWW